MPISHTHLIVQHYRAVHADRARAFAADISRKPRRAAASP